MAGNSDLSFFVSFYDLDPSDHNSCIYFTKTSPQRRCRCDPSDQERAIKLYDEITADDSEDISLELLEEYIKCSCCMFNNARHRERIEDAGLLTPLALRWQKEIHERQLQEIEAQESQILENQIQDNQIQESQTQEIQQRYDTRSRPVIVPQAPLSEFRPHKEAPTMFDTISYKICEPLKDRDFESGSLYIFNRESSPGHVKIGWTARSTVQKRLDEWSKCGYNPNLLFDVHDVPFAQRVETLTHYELFREWRTERMCKAPWCGKSHREWFEVGQDRAAQVLGDWAELFKSVKLYEEKWGSLKPDWWAVVEAMDKKGEAITAKGMLEHYRESSLERAAIAKETTDPVPALKTEEPEHAIPAAPKIEEGSQGAAAETVKVLKGLLLNEKRTSSDEALLFEMTQILLRHYSQTQAPPLKQEAESSDPSPFENRPLLPPKLPSQDEPLPGFRSASIIPTTDKPQANKEPSIKFQPLPKFETIFKTESLFKINPASKSSISGQVEPVSKTDATFNIKPLPSTESWFASKSLLKEEQSVESQPAESVFGIKLPQSSAPFKFDTKSKADPTLGSASGSSSLFGAPSGSKSLFRATSESKSIFGAAPGPSSLFGSTSTSKSKPLFGTVSETTTGSKPVFGSTSGPNSLFGAPSGSKSIFGSTLGSTSIFGTTAGSGSLFQSASSPKTDSVLNVKQEAGKPFKFEVPQNYAPLFKSNPLPSSTPSTRPPPETELPKKNDPHPGKTYSREKMSAPRKIRVKLPPPPHPPSTLTSPSSKSGEEPTQRDASTSTESIAAQILTPSSSKHSRETALIDPPITSRSSADRAEPESDPPVPVVTELADALLSLTADQQDKLADALTSTEGGDQNDAEERPHAQLGHESTVSESEDQASEVETIDSRDQDEAELPEDGEVEPRAESDVERYEEETESHDDDNDEEEELGDHDNQDDTLLGSEGWDPDGPTLIEEEDASAAPGALEKVALKIIDELTSDVPVAAAAAAVNVTVKELAEPKMLEEEAPPTIGGVALA